MYNEKRSKRMEIRLTLSQRKVLEYIANISGLTYTELIVQWINILSRLYKL